MGSKKPVYVTKAFLPPFNEFVEGMKEIWETGLLTNQGPLHAQLMCTLAEYLKVDNLVLFVNGHQALEIALTALQLPPGGEVITTPYSFASTTHAIVNHGLVPVFADIRFQDYNLDPQKIEQLVTKKTCAILPVHVYGNLCDVDFIDDLAHSYDLKVVYDAAHAFGVERNGRGAGTFGDISMFSFHATKVFNTIEGGALTFQNSAYTQKLNLLKNFGIAGPEDVLSAGVNAKMNEFQALMGIVNLRHMDEEIGRRKFAVERYREDLADIEGLRLLPDFPGIRATNAYMPVLIDEKQYGLTRDGLFELLGCYDIHARKYFFPLIPDYECYRGKYPADIPTARYVAERIITLPLWGEIPLSVIDETCEIIRRKS